MLGRLTAAGGSVIGAAQGVLRLPPRDRGPFLRASWELLCARVGLRFGATRRRLLRGLDAHARCESPPDERLLSLFAEAVRRQPTPPLCLPRAVALSRFLAAMGVRTRLRLGVRREDGQPLEGHAWVEWDGGAIAEPTPPVRSFVPLTWAGASRS